MVRIYKILVCNLPKCILQIQQTCERQKLKYLALAKKQSKIAIPTEKHGGGSIILRALRLVGTLGCLNNLDYPRWFRHAL